jgi:hypothetical protein
MLKFFLFFTVIVFLFSSSLTHSSELPEILDYYPDCDFKVIGEVTKGTKQRGTFKESFSYKEKMPIVRRLFKQIQEHAKEKQADAIIIIEQTIKSNLFEINSGKQRAVRKVGYTAQLIDLNRCENTNGSKVTPYDHDGTQQIGGTKTFTLSKQIQISSPQEDARNMPTITSNNISLTEGIYGVKLGTPFEKVVNSFGSPSIIFTADNRHKILSYGRRHWFVFQDDKLVEAGNVNKWFSKELVNQIPFDERFDDMSWIIDEKVNAKAPLDQVQNKLGAKLLSGHQKLISETPNEVQTLTFSTYVNKPSAPTSLLLDSFEIRQKSYNPDNLSILYSYQGVYEQISNHLMDQSNKTLQPSALSTVPLAKIWLNEISYKLVYSPYLIATVRGNDIVKLYFTENLFQSEGMPKRTNWSFLRVSQWQTLHEVTELFGKGEPGFSGELLVTTDGYVKRLYFDDVDGESKVVAANITIF